MGPLASTLDPYVSDSAKELSMGPDGNVMSDGFGMHEPVVNPSPRTGRRRFERVGGGSNSPPRGVAGITSKEIPTMYAPH